MQKIIWWQNLKSKLNYGISICPSKFYKSHVKANLLNHVPGIFACVRACWHSLVLVRSRAWRAWHVHLLRCLARFCACVLGINTHTRTHTHTNIYIYIYYIYILYIYIFLIKPLFYKVKKSRQKFKYLENERTFKINKMHFSSFLGFS